MDTQTTLSNAAAVGIGVAGFSTIAAAVLSRSTNEDLAISCTQLRVLLTTSLGITLFTYASMVAGSVLQDEETIWRVSNSLCAVWILTILLLVGLRTVKPLMPTSGSVRKAATASMLLGLISVTLNDINALYLTASWPYLSALACGLLIVFIQFGQLVRALWLGRNAIDR